MLTEPNVELVPTFNPFVLNSSYTEEWIYTSDRRNWRSGKPEKTNFKNNATFLNLKAVTLLTFRNSFFNSSLLFFITDCVLFHLSGRM